MGVGGLIFVQKSSFLGYPWFNPIRSKRKTKLNRLVVQSHVRRVGGHNTKLEVQSHVRTRSGQNTKVSGSIPCEKK